MDQASAWHCCMVPMVATLATLVGSSYSDTKNVANKNQKPQVTTARRK